MKLPKGIAHTIERNPHVIYYQTPAQYLAEIKHYEPGLLAQIEASGELWELAWYPRSPAGYQRVIAASLEDLLAKAGE